MKQLVLIIFALALTASQESSLEDDAMQFAEGVNSGLGQIVDPDVFILCEKGYTHALSLTTSFLEYLFYDWNADYFLIDGWMGIDYAWVLQNFEETCQPVSSAYEIYFAQAIQ